MTQHPETLTQLVLERVSAGLTYRAFARAAVDPKSQYKPGQSTLFKIAKGQPVMLSPELVGAVAAGLGLDLERVARAAAYQYAGYRSVPLEGGAVVHREAGAPDSSLAREQAVEARWDEEERAGE